VSTFHCQAAALLRSVGLFCTIKDS
jgi:hypothetical protein